MKMKSEEKQILLRTIKQIKPSEPIERITRQEIGQFFLQFNEESRMFLESKGVIPETEFINF